MFKIKKVKEFKKVDAHEFYIWNFDNYLSNKKELDKKIIDYFKCKENIEFIYTDEDISTIFIAKPCIVFQLIAGDVYNIYYFSKNN
jgi:hypothetical protein